MSGSWIGSETFDIQAALQAAGFPSTSHATKLSLDLDNILTARKRNGQWTGLDQQEFL